MTLRPLLRPWGALAPALLMAGCAAAGAPVAAGPRTIAVVHLAELEDHLVLPIGAGGTLVEALLDTGAAESVVTAAAAGTLDARAVHDVGENDNEMMPPIVVSGVGGDTDAQLLEVPRLDLAGGRLLDAQLVEVPALRFRDRRIAGLVGSDLLQNWDLDLDGGTRLLRLDRPQQGPVRPPWTDATTRVPLERQTAVLIRFRAKLDGHDMRVVLDTGAATTLIAAGSAAAAEAPDTEDGAGFGSGVAGHRFALRRHHFRSLSVGGLDIGPVDAGIGPIGIPDADMLLGLDVLRTMRIYVAYQASELLIDDGSP